MALEFFERNLLPVSPWKNGGGTTTEIVCWPPGAGLDNFEWRVSISRIAKSGPFSAFKGINRVVMLLEGDGVMLRAHDGSFSYHMDTPLQPFPFSGDTALDCTMLGGESADFNLMMRRGLLRGRIYCLSQAYGVGAVGQGVLLVWQGRWHIRAETEDGQTHVKNCDAGQGLWWAEQPSCVHAEPQTPDSRLLWVEILPA